MDLLILLILLAATYTDLRTRRIPDKLTFPALATVLVLALLQGGLGDGWFTPGLKGALAGALLAYLLFAVLVVLGWMGGGDAKLMAVVGAFARIPDIVGIIFFVVIAGGLLGMLALLAKSPPGRRLALKLGIKGARDPDFGKTLPYAPAILLGTLGFRLWLYSTPILEAVPA